jgi:glucose dehydrogenase
MYFGSSNGYLYGIHVGNGTKIWEYQTTGEIRSSPTLSGGKLYFGSFDDSVYCLNAMTGQKVWSYATGGNVLAQPVLSSDGSKLFVGSDDKALIALNPQTGASLWSFPSGGKIRGSPVQYGTNVYFASDKLYALSTDSGSQVWAHNLAAPTSAGPALSTNGSSVCIGSNSYRLVCVHTSNGTKWWEFATGGYITAAAVIADVTEPVRKICAAGTFLDISQPQVCHQCTAGRYNDLIDQRGASACKNCAPGLSQASAGQATCSSCPRGQYQAIAGQLICSACLAGKYGNQTDATSPAFCLPCSDGEFQTLTAQPSCTQCPAGYFRGQGDQLQTCKLCISGQYAAVGRGKCTKCAPGMLNN